jgi:hypothetical protein
MTPRFFPAWPWADHGGATELWGGFPKRDSGRVGP